MSISAKYGRFLQYLAIFYNHIGESAKDIYHFICESAAFDGFVYIEIIYHLCGAEIKFAVSYAEIYMIESMQHWQ
jgi:hypothetical protein